MERIAIFVEGYTELCFISALITEVAGENNVAIEQRQILGGATVPRTVLTIKASNPIHDRQFFVLIYDCGGDSQVKARIVEEHENLTHAGYRYIVGIRDVFPQFVAADIPKLRMGLKRYIKGKLVPVHFILGVMEVESWFLSEHTHFSRIDGTLTCAGIATALGFDPQIDDMTARHTPAEDLNQCYKLVGKEYFKGDSPTIRALDYAHVYFEVPNRIADLRTLVELLESFLGASAEAPARV